MPKKDITKDIVAKFQQGEQEIRQKRGISYEEAKKRLRKWVK